MVQYTAGQRIRGSEINALPQLYFTTSDQTKNNSNQFSDATGLGFTAEGSARYLVECFLAYRGDATRDIKFQWRYPAGASGWWAADGIEAGNTSGSGSVGQVNRQTVPLTNIHAFSGENSAGVDVNAKPVLYIATAAPPGGAGVVQLQWAQLTAGTFNTILLAGSCLRVSRMG